MTRLLALVPYLTARPEGVALAEAARDFGVSERQLRSDLELLWMCGLPGYGPGDLIDLSFEGDRVRVTFTAGMVRPLRLTTDEAVALVVALKTLLELPGLAEREAVSRALAKVSADRRARGRAGHAGRGQRRRPRGGARRRPRGAGAQARAAPALLRAHPRRAHRADRRPDAPAAGRRRAGTSRRGAAGPRACGCSGSTGSTTSSCSTSRPPRRRRRTSATSTTASTSPTPGSPAVRLRLSRSARWVADYYPVDSVAPVDDPPGGLAVTVRTEDLAWARRLVASLGGEALVDEPAELAAQVAADARAALARYGTAAADDAG